MSARHHVLLIDDGELDLVRELLEELGVEHGQLAAAKARRPVPLPHELLVSTASAALELQCRRTPSATAPRSVWIAFMSADSEEERAALQAAGFDFTVRQPVHPAALRLLLRRALYEGEENRLVKRVAIGEPITYRVGLWRQRGVLAELSPRGCRLLCADKLPFGARVRLRIPRQATGGRTLRLTGSVLRNMPGPEGGGQAGETAVALRFRPLSAKRRESLQQLLRNRIDGPAVLRSPVAPPVEPAGVSVRPPRATYDGAVAALCEDGTHVLLGRALSPGGIRVEPNAVLSVGDDIQLAIHGSSREEPFLVGARVVRDDGERGMALQFESLDPGARLRLESLIESLPAIESLLDAPRSTFLTQLVPGLRG